MEQPMFVAGDKVVCIDSSKDPRDAYQLQLIDGKTYVIQSINRCKCGRLSVDVGHFQPFGYSTYCDCYLAISSTKVMYDQKRFAFPEEVQQWENEINSALKGIPETL